jgi:hypothetical protein
MDLTMGMTVTRPLEVSWDASPDAVAAALSRAIAERRYADAGDDTAAHWRAMGTVDGRNVDLRTTTAGAPGVSGPGIALAVRGELVPDNGGTRLVASASVPRRRQELPLFAGICIFLAAVVAVGIGSAAGLPATLIIFGIVLALNWTFMTVVNGRLNQSLLPTTPQVEAALTRLGTPSAGA